MFQTWVFLTNPYLMDDLERNWSFLTSNEKKMIVRVHQYFLSILQR